MATLLAAAHPSAWAQYYPNPGTVQRDSQPVLTVPEWPSSQRINIGPSSVRISPAVPFFSYRIERDLRLTYSYRYNFAINLEAVKNGVGKQTVPDGMYQLTIAVIRSPLHEHEPLSERYVTSLEPQFIEVTNERAVREVTLSFPNVTSTVMLSSLVIELIPLNTDCNGSPCFQFFEDGTADPSRSRISPRTNLKPILFEIEFVPFKRGAEGSGNVTTVSSVQRALGGLTLAKFAFDQENLQRRKRSFKPVTPEAHARESKLHLVDLQDADFKESLARWAPDVDANALLNRIFTLRGQGPLVLDDSTNPLYPALCGLLAKRNQMHRFLAMDPPIIRCQFRPQEQLRLTRIVHVGAIDRSRPVTRMKAPNKTWNVMANFMVSRGQSEDTFTAFTLKPFGFMNKVGELLNKTPLKALDLFTSGVDLSHTVGFSNSRSRSESQIGSMLESMDVQPFLADIPTVNSRVCLEVRVLPSTLMYREEPNAINGLYICGQTQAQLTVSEQYTHIFTRTTDSPNGSAHDPHLTRINLMLRGERDTSQFFYQTRESMHPDNGNDIVFPSAVEGAEKYFALTPQVSDGLIVSPIQFKKQTVPSFLQKAFGLYSEKF